jgi:amidase
MMTAIGASGSTVNLSNSDALIIGKLREYGAIVFIKTSMPQLGLSLECLNFIIGRTLNPHDKTRSPGGSSGGEAALLAAKCSVVGIASDIAGSIRWPALSCGVYGFKPTSRRISAMAENTKRGGPPTLRGSWGPMARCADDLITLTDLMIEGSASDSTICYIPFDYDKVNSKSKLRIGIV